MDSLPSNASDVFACCLVGEGVLLRQCAERLRERGHLVAAVVSSEPSAVRWCEEWSVPRVPAGGELRDFLANIPFDYLFSIVNHNIVDAEILGLARRGGINYHDSPLPRYAGFNVTSWAILHGETSHGVTWHEMAEKADAGRILKQRLFDIAPDDTAFSLAARCHAAALETFGELIEELGEGRVAPKDQLAEARTYFSRHTRPVSVLDWTKPAEELARLVRALDLGPENSPLGVPKFRVNGSHYLLLEAEVTTTPSSLPPSSVVSLDDGAMCVATGSVDLRILRVAELDGATCSLGELVRANALRVEGLLGAPPSEALAAFDAAASKHERFWIQRLAELAPATLPYVRATGLGGETVEEIVTDCPGLTGATADGDFIAVAFALFLGRLGLGEAFDLGFDLGPTRTEFDGLFVRQVPWRVEWNAESSFESAAAGVRERIEDLRKRQGFATDVWARQSVLRGSEHFGFRRGYPVVVGLGASEGSLLPGTDLELSIVESRLHFRFNGAALSADAVRRVVSQFGAFVEEARPAPSTLLHRLPIVSAGERRLVLDEWNRTSREVSILCVHHFFEQKTQENPGAPAVAFRDQKLSYAELNTRANELAHRLIRAGALPDGLVGIYLDRSIEMLIAMLGVLKAGAAYVPLDPNYPAERLSWMLEDSKAALVVTDRRLHPSLPSHGATVMYVEDDASNGVTLENPRVDVRPEHLAYVIFTSGSTGRPKGVMIEHRNVANFFAGMDERVGVPAPGDPEPTWLAVTSISFDIHVLELLWTLARGFKIVLAEDQSAARVRASQSQTRPIDFSLFYFASDAGGSGADRYRLLLEGAKFADEHDFSAVWTPERHFHAFGGLYPNPAVTSAALAAVTRRIQIRAGSVVLPLHHPVRVAEEWSVVDNLSGGRVGLSFASGWHANDFAFAPQNYADRKDIMFRGIETIRKLWLGESVDAQSGDGKAIQIKIQPLPIRPRPPIWITAAGSVETFRAAGEKGFNLLTNLLGQSIHEVTEKIAAYRDAWRKAGHSGQGTVTVMVHTFVTTDAKAARATVYEPFSSYLQSSFDLIKMAPWAFPAFRQPSKAASDDTALDPTSFSAEDLKALLDHAFDRYFESAGLFGTPETCSAMVDRLRDAGVNEIACLIDFGVDPEVVLSNLTHLSRLREQSNAASEPAQESEYSLAAQIREHGVTHVQCTPSLARMMLADPETFDAMRSLRTVLLGGEALPAALAAELYRTFEGRLINMYGPTETTVWSTTFAVPDAKEKTEITIGRPIANTEIYLLDAKMEPVPVGVPGELYIGGAGVARGYLFRQELTRERFVDHPFKTGARLYRTGDLARYATSGDIEFLGRNDHQIKIRGFRIELGEIEAVLGKHPSVKEVVVVARDQSGVAPELVAYWVPRAVASGALTDDWHAIWDETYRQGEAPRSAENLNLAGWKSTYTGEALPEEEMREWVAHTVERIQQLRPRRVLEIGCGTGLLLTRLAAGCESYTGVDFSETALEHVRKEVIRRNLGNVTLVCAAAHELPPFGQFDTIVLNSIVQYFPNADYLRRVLDTLAGLLAPGGSLFVGDVRSLPLLPAFHTSVELFQAPETRTVTEVRERILRRERQENELVLHPDFFREWAKQSGASVSTELKRGFADNEMTRFRYDVVLAASAAKPAPSERTVATTLEAARARLADAVQPICFADVPNARLTTALAAVEILARAADSATVKDVRDALKSVTGGERPEPFWALAPASHVRIDFAESGALDRFDVHVSPSGVGESEERAGSPTALSVVKGASLDAFANRPKPRNDGTPTSATLKEHARGLLPEYMVPTEFVSLERLPLTPNGKLDRKALPAPRAERQASTRAYVAAENDVEQIILGVWQELLNLEQLGATENFFDLGANSLLMVQANAQLKLRLDRSVSLLDMFRFSNARTLAAHLGRSRAAADSPTPSQDRAQSRRDALSRQRAMRASRVR